MAGKNLMHENIEYNAFKNMGLFNDMDRLENAIGDVCDLIWFIKGMKVMDDPIKNPFTTQERTLIEILEAMRKYQRHLKTL